MKSAQETQIMGSGKVGPTPEQMARIDELVKRFDRDWTVDVKKLEIKRKDRSLFRKIWDYFFPKRHTVFALYWWLKHRFHRRDRVNMMAFTFPIKHDNMPISGYPIKYEIVGGWKIPQRDRRYLVKGPLARINPTEILVSHEIGLEKLKSFARAWGPIFAVIAALLTIMLRTLQLAAII